MSSACGTQIRCHRIPRDASFRLEHKHRCLLLDICGWGEGTDLADPQVDWRILVDLLEEKQIDCDDERALEDLSHTRVCMLDERELCGSPSFDFRSWRLSV